VAVDRCGQVGEHLVLDAVQELGQGRWQGPGVADQQQGGAGLRAQGEQGLQTGWGEGVGPQQHQGPGRVGGHPGAGGAPGLFVSAESFRAELGYRVPERR
jgi:hypothetical protein